MFNIGDDGGKMAAFVLSAAADMRAARAEEGLDKQKAAEDSKIRMRVDMSNNAGVARMHIDRASRIISAEDMLRMSRNYEELMRKAQKSVQDMRRRELAIEIMRANKDAAKTVITYYNKKFLTEQRPKAGDGFTDFSDAPMAIKLLWKEYHRTQRGDQILFIIRDKLHGKATGMELYNENIVASAVDRGEIGDRALFAEFLKNLQKEIESSLADYNLSLAQVDMETYLSVNKVKIAHFEQMLSTIEYHLPMMEVNDLFRNSAYHSTHNCDDRPWNGRPSFEYPGVEFKRKAVIHGLVNPVQTSRQAQAKNAQRYKHTQARDANRKALNKKGYKK